MTRNAEDSLSHFEILPFKPVIVRRSLCQTPSGFSAILVTAGWLPLFFLGLNCSSTRWSRWQTIYLIFNLKTFSWWYKGLNTQRSTGWHTCRLIPLSWPDLRFKTMCRRWRVFSMELMIIGRTKGRLQEKMQWKVWSFTRPFSPAPPNPPFGLFRYKKSPQIIFVENEPLLRETDFTLGPI